MIPAPATIPAPGLRSLELGPFDIRLYALCMLVGILVAGWLTMRRWAARGGDPEVVFEIGLWAVAFGLVGGRLYHVITSWDQLGDQWYAPFAVWEGGLGIWGAIALGTAAGAWAAHRRGVSVTALMDAAAPGVLIAQGIGRLGNYFNQELFGGPSSLPWALEVDPARRPADTLLDATYHPTFLYEMLWNFAGAALLIVLGRRVRITPPGLFCLYVAYYSLGRIFWEQLRVDPSHMFLGQRVNFWVALALMVGALACFAWIQRRAGEDDRGGDTDPQAVAATGTAATGTAATGTAATGGATAARLAAAKEAQRAPVTPRSPGGRAKTRRRRRR